MQASAGDDGLSSLAEQAAQLAEMITTNRKAAAVFRLFPTYMLVLIIVSFDIKHIYLGQR